MRSMKLQLKYAMRGRVTGLQMTITSQRGVPKVVSYGCAVIVRVVRHLVV